MMALDGRFWIGGKETLVDKTGMRNFIELKFIIGSLKLKKYYIFSVKCASGSNDCTLKLWDVRERKYSASFKVGYQITSVAFNHGNSIIYFGGIDNTIRGINLRKHQIEYHLIGHSDTVTSISLSPSGALPGLTTILTKIILPKDHRDIFGEEYLYCGGRRHKS